MKKWDLSKSPFLCSEQQLAAPHGNASLWQCLLSTQPYPQQGLLQGGPCVRAFLPSAEKKGKRWGNCSVKYRLPGSPKLLHVEALHSTEYRWTPFLLSEPWPHPSSSRFGCGAQGRGQPLDPGVASSLLPSLCQPWPILTPLPLTLDPLTVPDFPNTSSDSQSRGTKMR